MVLYICKKFHNNIWDGFQLTEWTREHDRNGYVQMAITPKVGKPEVRFMCSAHCLVVLYIYVKFHGNILDSIRVMERTRMIKGLMDGHSKFQTL